MHPLLIPLFGKVIDTVGNFLDPTKKAEAELALLKLQQDASFRDAENELRRMETAMSAINTEGASADPYTSRARPSFLYVMYIVILVGLPLSFLAIWFPTEITTVQATFGAWVKGLPEEMWWLFGTGYLGYAGARTWEKTKGASK